MPAITVLYLAANPFRDGLRLDEEIREIYEEIRLAEFRDRIRLVSHFAVRAKDLRRALRDEEPDVVHFAGHGNDTGEIILASDAHRPAPVRPDALLQLFNAASRRTRLVVLNACFSLPQATAITETVDCAVGMSCAVGDHAAITFAASFYGAIATGQSVRVAFAQGNAAIQLEGLAEHTTPQLVCRVGVDPSNVILIDGTGGGRGQRPLDILRDGADLSRFYGGRQ